MSDHRREHFARSSGVVGVAELEDLAPRRQRDALVEDIDDFPHSDRLGPAVHLRQDRRRGFGTLKTAKDCFRGVARTQNV